MSMTITVSNEIARHLDDLTFDDTLDIEGKLRSLIIAEYQRRLVRFRLTDRQLTQKYNKNFAAFEQVQMIRQKGYTWEVESDAIAWETAIDGMQTIEQQLSSLLGKGRKSDH